MDIDKLAETVKKRKAFGTVPFAPEPIAALKARYAAALVTEFTPELQRQCERAEVAHVQQRAEHVFDFQSGIRMVACKDVMPSGHYAHFAFSVRQPGVKISAAHLTMMATQLAYEFSGLSEVLKSGFIVTSFHMILRMPVQQAAILENKEFAA